jgi:LysM repeat protein
MGAASWRARLARYVAPAAFLVAATVAVLLIRSGIHGGHGSKAKPLPTVTQSNPTTVPRGKAVYYRVRNGDTLGGIANQFKTTLAALRTLNPKVDPNALQLGQKLRVR